MQYTNCLTNKHCIRRGQSNGKPMSTFKTRCQHSNIQPMSTFKTRCQHSNIQTMSTFKTRCQHSNIQPMSTFKTRCQHSNIQTMSTFKTRCQHSNIQTMSTFEYPTDANIRISNRCQHSDIQQYPYLTKENIQIPTIEEMHADIHVDISQEQKWISITVVTGGKAEIDWIANPFAIRTQCNDMQSTTWLTCKFRRW